MKLKSRSRSRILRVTKHFERKLSLKSIQTNIDQDMQRKHDTITLVDQSITKNLKK